MECNYRNKEKAKNVGNEVFFILITIIIQGSVF